VREVIAVMGFSEANEEDTELEDWPESALFTAARSNLGLKVEKMSRKKI
jgi:hypothetical protein